MQEHLNKGAVTARQVKPDPSAVFKEVEAFFQPQAADIK
jgi:hypothetical protein